MYQLKVCEICGAVIPVSSSSREVTCDFCSAQYEVVRTQESNGQAEPSPSPGQIGWFLGGVAVGFLLGWPVSRAALATVARVSVAELERRAEEWGRR